MMYKIMVAEFRNIRGEKKIVSEPTEFEYHNNKINAIASMTYLSFIFGKHYTFYIVEHKQQDSFNG